MDAHPHAPLTHARRPPTRRARPNGGTTATTPDKGAPTRSTVGLGLGRGEREERLGTPGRDVARPPPTTTTNREISPREGPHAAGGPAAQIAPHRVASCTPTGQSAGPPGRPMGRIRGHGGDVQRGRLRWSPRTTPATDAATTRSAAREDGQTRRTCPANAIHAQDGQGERAGREEGGDAKRSENGAREAHSPRNFQQVGRCALQRVVKWYACHLLQLVGGGLGVGGGSRGGRGRAKRTNRITSCSAPIG